VALVVAGAGQATEQNVEECVEDLFEGLRRVGDDNLPDVQRRLPHELRDVATAHVQA